MSRLFSAVVALITLSTGFLPSAASTHEPYNLPRIYWDINSRQVIFPTGNYSRMIPLQDGRLMAVAEAGGGISCSYSSNGGQTWSSPELIIRSALSVPYAVPDLIQLSDGTIVVGYNPRPSKPYSDDRRFGIRSIRSTDNGKTWEEPVYVFDAQAVFEDGCWEPSFLELPGGELQLYFANENNFVGSNDQEISMCRSYDQGQSWSSPVRISYRAGSRDGMPSAILTDNNEIVVIIEDNGHPGCGSFRATTVRTSLDSNWMSWTGGDSQWRNMIFADDSERGAISAAPYIRKLPSGYTVASWQGNRGDRAGFDEGRFDMFVAVGDRDARGFKAISQPFGVSSEEHSLWNSVNTDHDGNVIALASIGERNGDSNAITMMKGYPMTGFTASYGTPAVDGSFSGETWTTRNAQQVFMGAVTRKRATMDFLYDKDNLYFFARVVDRNIFTDKVDDDGITLAFDTGNCCDTYPQEGMFRLFLDANGSVKMYAGESNKWKQIATPEGISFVANVRANYYDMEIAIPWSALGCDAAPVGRTMRCYLEIRDRRESNIVDETIPDAQLRQSWTWPEFRLTPAEDTAIERIGADNPVTEDFTAGISGGNLTVSSSGNLTGIRLYSMTGQCAVSDRFSGNTYSRSLPGICGIYVLEVGFSDGTVRHRKIAVH